MKRFFFIACFVLGTIAGFAQDAADLINQANEALKAKDYAKAFELYDKAMKNLGDVQVDPSINFNIGFAAVQADKFDDALTYFDKAIAANTNVPKSYEYKANAYAKLDKYNEAIDAYQKAVDAGAEEKGSLYYNAGIVAYKANMFDKASGLFSKAVAENYNAENAVYYQAVSLNKLNKDDEYKQVLIEGAGKFPQNSKITAALAGIYVREGNELYKKGASVLNEANQKVAAGSMKTTDAAYTAQVDKSKVEFKAALELLNKAKGLDAANKNVGKLIEACNTALQ